MKITLAARLPIILFGAALTEGRERILSFSNVNIHTPVFFLRSTACFMICVFQGSLLVIVIMIDGSEKRNCEVGF